LMLSAEMYRSRRFVPVTYGKAVAAVGVLQHVGAPRSLRAVTSRFASERMIDEEAWREATGAG
jgi:hypothetical protein